MKKRASEMDVNRLAMPNEDPYRSFRRSLIAGQKGSAISPRGGIATAVSVDKRQTVGSRESRVSKGDAAEAYELSMEGSDSVVIKSQLEGGRRQGSSYAKLNPNKVQMGSNVMEVERFMADLHNRDSADSSMMMIEVSDLEIKEQSNSNSRAQTSLKVGDYTGGKLVPPLIGGSRYQSNRANPMTIVT